MEEAGVEEPATKKVRRRLIKTSLGGGPAGSRRGKAVEPQPAPMQPGGDADTVEMIDLIGGANAAAKLVRSISDETGNGVILTSGDGDEEEAPATIGGQIKNLRVTLPPGLSGSSQTTNK